MLFDAICSLCSPFGVWFNILLVSFPTPPGSAKDTVCLLSSFVWYCSCQFFCTCLCHSMSLVFPNAYCVCPRQSVSHVCAGRAGPSFVLFSLSLYSPPARWGPLDFSQRRSSIFSSFSSPAPLPALDAAAHACIRTPGGSWARLNRCQNECQIEGLNIFAGHYFQMICQKLSK